MKICNTKNYKIKKMEQKKMMFIFSYYSTKIYIFNFKRRLIKTYL